MTRLESTRRRRREVMGKRIEKDVHKYNYKRHIPMENEIRRTKNGAGDKCFRRKIGRIAAKQI